MILPDRSLARKGEEKVKHLKRAYSGSKSQDKISPFWYFCICHFALLYSVESVQCPKKAKIKFHLSRQRESLEINPLKYLSCSNISHFTKISHIQTSYSSRFFSCLNILAQSCQLKNLHDISHSFTEMLLKKHT